MDTTNLKDLLLLGDNDLYEFQDSKMDIESKFVNDKRKGKSKKNKK